MKTFGTDSGPACPTCKGAQFYPKDGEGLWSYRIMGEHSVVAKCGTCHSSFAFPWHWPEDETTVQEVRRKHEHDFKNVRPTQ